MDRKRINDRISCVLLRCFNQPFGLSFWRHPFTAKGPLVCKWSNAKFFQIYDDETNSSMIRGWASFLKIVIFWVNYSLKSKKHKRPCVTLHFWSSLCRCGDDVWMSVHELISFSVLFQHPLCVRRWWHGHFSELLRTFTCRWRWWLTVSRDIPPCRWPQRLLSTALLHRFHCPYLIFHPQHMGIPQKQMTCYMLWSGLTKPVSRTMEKSNRQA